MECECGVKVERKVVGEVMRVIVTIHVTSFKIRSTAD